MPAPTPQFATLDDWIAREAIPFSLESPVAFEGAVARVVQSLGESLELLGFGEPMHGAEAVLMLRNRLFERLVIAHGFSAIALETSFPRARVVNEFVAGRDPRSWDEVREAGFSHGFGRLEANRELVTWMKSYNADPSHPVTLRFYGFDSPSEMVGTDSPRQTIQFVLDYLASIDGDAVRDRRERIERLLGRDADWENPAASFDPVKSIGLSPEAAELRIEIEELGSMLQVRRPELVAASGAGYWEALQYGSVARQLLTYHAALARPSSQRLVDLLGIRDAMMADNLVYAVSRERGRGKVLAVAHNSHLQRGKAEWRLGPNALAWWPAGSHLHELLGDRYATIGSGVGVSDANGIGPPEALTLEARLTAVAGPGRFIPTHGGTRLPEAALAALPVRSGSARNAGYFPLAARSLTDFDWLAVLDSTTDSRGEPPLP